jgi:hypothetical protein
MKIKGVNRLVALVGITLLGGAIMKELLKPAEDRTWHGRVAGFVPYDFRTPTWQRLRTTFWDPDDSRVVKDKVFGVGWDVNVGAIARKAGLVS